MLPCCLKGRKNTKTEKPKVEKILKRPLLSNCEICDSKKLRFVKEQEAEGLSSKFAEIKVPILGDLLITNFSFLKKKTNK